MELRLNLITKLIFFVSLTIFYCEYLIYYVVIMQCSWPEFSVQPDQPDSIIKALFLADTHLLGPYRGHWFDKLRREWQMHRAFQTAVTLYRPEVVFVLGDLFDEGQWCDYRQFLEYFERFLSLFSLPSDTQMYVVPGNHDVGFHYSIRPFVLRKFEDLFNTSSVQFLNFKGSYFILINSMAMEGDGCDLCSDAEKKLKNVAAELRCAKNNKTCAGVHIKNYSRPIVLQHFPMYRKSDLSCDERDEAPPEIKNTAFREKWDCLSQSASEMIFKELNPRAIFSGHVHHGCHLIHKRDIHEYTLPSFSWRNKNNPTFTLAKITQNDYVLEKCDIPRETTVIFLYCCAILGIVARVTCLIRLKLKLQYTRFIALKGASSIHIYARKSVFVYEIHTAQNKWNIVKIKRTL